MEEMGKQRRDAFLKEYDWEGMEEEAIHLLWRSGASVVVEPNRRNLAQAIYDLYGGKMVFQGISREGEEVFLKKLSREKVARKLTPLLPGSLKDNVSVGSRELWV